MKDLKNPRQHWTEYRNAVFKGAIPLDQERECSSAFYAGMMAAIDFLTSLDEEEPERTLEQRIFTYCDAIGSAAREANKKGRFSGN